MGAGYAAVDLLGWVGAAAVLLAYWLISTHRAKADAAGFQSLNLLGGVLLALNTGYYRAYPSTLVNVIWVGITVYALMRRSARAAS